MAPFGVKMPTTFPSFIKTHSLCIIFSVLEHFGIFFDLSQLNHFFELLWLNSDVKTLLSGGRVPSFRGSQKSARSESQHRLFILRQYARQTLAGHTKWQWHNPVEANRVSVFSVIKQKTNWIFSIHVCLKHDTTKQWF